MTLSWLSCALLVVLALFAIVEIGLRGLQLVIAMVRPPVVAERRAMTQGATQDFVSVHIPICNEPPAMVIATLDWLARIDFARFEIIVIDNNTANSGLWRPVEAACARLGSRFRFMHVDRVAGAKAGALNLALAAADPRTTHVAVVDADYQVLPPFLTDALAALRRCDVDYVQFPQAYRSASPRTLGVECELGDYFACFAGAAETAGAMLPTGTLSLFSVAALRAVGGWPMATITEDAEMGVRLQAAGFRGMWVARKMGHGLLPVDLKGIRMQRSRWCAGNFQVLKRLLDRETGFGIRSWAGARDRLYLLAQLTSWITLILLPSAVLAVLPLLPGLPMRAEIADLAATAILVPAALTACRMVVIGDPAAGPLVRLEAMMTKLALTWTSATAWLPALLPWRLTFHRTAKEADEGARDVDPAGLGVSFAFSLATLAYLMAGAVWPALACVLLASIWPCGRFVDHALRQSLPRSMPVPARSC